MRVPKSTCSNPVSPSPWAGQPHLCSLATRRSLSSLPRNPLAKGLFSIFSCVICRKRTRGRVVVKREPQAWPASHTPGSLRTRGRARRPHTAALSQLGSTQGPPQPCHSHVACPWLSYSSPCSRPSDSFSCSPAHSTTWFRLSLYLAPWPMALSSETTTSDSQGRCSVQTVPCCSPEALLQPLPPTPPVLVCIT